MTDLLQGNIKTTHLKYLSAVFGSALISTVHSIVDTVMVGQYQGPEGTAAPAVVIPVWNIIYSLGFLTGTGGSVLSGAAEGKGERRIEGEYFTAALMITVVLAAVSWLMVPFSDIPTLHLFGAEETLLPPVREYLYPTKFVVPLSLFNQMLAAFLCNDGNPGLATAAVLSGGTLNIIEDYLSVFVLGMGIMGVELATAARAGTTFAGMVSHFFTKKNTMRLVRPSLSWGKCRRIIVTSFSILLIDVAMGILTMLFNRQIMRYLGGSILSVYGMIINISTIIRCCTYSVGQASQPVLSICFGAGKWDRIEETLKYALYPVACFSVVWTPLVFTFPNGFIYIFMAPTDEIYHVTPFILRSCGISSLLLPLNVFFTYYFQAFMKPGVSFLASVLRGLILSGIMTYLLPITTGPDSLWFAMVITKAAVAVLVIPPIRRYAREPPVGQTESKPGRPWNKSSIETGLSLVPVDTCKDFLGFGHA